MSRLVKVMAVMLPRSDGQATIRVRWALTGQEAFVRPEQALDSIAFPYPTDSFRVTLTNEDKGRGQSQEVYPRSYVMLDPPRRRTTLVAKPGDSQGRLDDWLPEGALTDWAPVDPEDGQLIDPAAPNRSKALGVGHLLRFSHIKQVHARIQGLALARLQDKRNASQTRFVALDDAEMALHAGVFASTLVHSPYAPARVFRELRAMLLAPPPSGATRNTPAIPDWLHIALSGDNPSTSLSPAERDARLAVLVHLLLDEDLRGEAERIAQQADSMRGLMALRASQGGTLIDYWCDFDKRDGEGGRPACDPASRGKVCLAAEAFGTGVDFPVDLSEAPDRWRIDVEHLSSFDTAYAPGSYTLHRSAGIQLRNTGASSFAPPAASSLNAWVDYQIVSSHLYDPDVKFDEQLEGLMGLAKPVTGDGQLTIQIARSADTALEAFKYDYSYNVYCIWDGESSGILQPWFDDPWRQPAPALSQLRPFLVTRRYSHRRDIADAFDQTRISELALLTDPPHEATPGMAESIEGDDGPIPYPPRDDGGALARISLNLREILPSEAHAALGVAWERRGGASPHENAQDKLWTVEKARPGSSALPPERLPQRYRLWVTAVDIFEQESEPVPVAAREPDAREGGDADPDTIFIARWRSPPPPPDGVETNYDIGTGRLEVSWRLGRQPVLGTAADIDRLPLDAEVFMLRRPLREIVATPVPPAALDDADANPALLQAVADYEAQGWERWRSERITSEKAAPPWRVGWVLGAADRGYEYRAVIAHAVPRSRRRFLHADTVQTVRYLVKRISQGVPVYEEAFWEIPHDGPLARYRNHPAFSPAASDRTATAMPTANDLPAFELTLDKARLLAAAPVRGVQGIDRDLALAKFITLRDTPSSGELTVAQRMLVDAALKRTGTDSLDAGAEEMFRTLLAREFSTANASGNPPLTQHPIIGLRGAVHLSWTDHDTGASHVPTVLYRIYTARGSATAAAHCRIRCTGPGTFTTNDTTMSIDAKRPVMVLIGPGGAWTGLATQADSVLTVRGLHAVDGHHPDPQSGTEYDCWIHEPHVAAEVKPPRNPARRAFDAALPVAGGHAETGLWWLATVNCIDGESWYDERGKPALMAVRLRETIAPAAPVRLEARAVQNFQTEAARPQDHEALHALQVLPDMLQPNDGPIFPRTILTWDPSEFNAAEQYILIERQDEDLAQESNTLRSQDPAWGLLQAIVSQPAGSPWSDDYVTLRAWLEGGAAPQPPQGMEPAQPHYFFSTGVSGDHAAWNLKQVNMLPPADEPWPDARSFADYFAAPPSNGDRASVTRGERRVRYRAYKMLDLFPQLPGPDPAQFHARYLVSEPSPWTAWVQADWPPFGIKTLHGATTDRADGPLVRFNVRSVFREARAATMAKRAAGDGELFFRVELRRQLDAAFGGGAATTLIGELLGVPVPDEHIPAAVLTADYSLERNAPGAGLHAAYTCSATLVARRRAKGQLVDTVLRMADLPHAFTVQVTPQTGPREQAVLVELEIVVG